jgi:tetratricopeptide (TPR) repeat protein
MTSLSPDKPGQNREIRLYLSGTFQDTQRERLLLHSKVFPVIRKLCEARRISFSVVDLRLGEVSAQTVEEQILSYGTSEIDRCRPYFLGIIGDHYGHIPSEIPSHLLHRLPWLEGKEISVTEVEIIHGALNSPKSSQALFYFRSPDWLRNLPVIDQDLLLDRPTPEEIRRYGPMEAQERINRKKQLLEGLKNRIRKSGLPFRENYSNPEDFARLVEQDLREMIGRFFQAESSEDLFFAEREIQEKFLDRHQGYFFFQEAFFDELFRHLDKNTGPIYLVGPEGSGKTTLLANWIRALRESRPHIPHIFHFCRAGSPSEELPFLLRRIAWELTQVGLSTQPLPPVGRQLPAAFQQFISRLPTDQKAVLVLDDEDAFDPVLEYFEDFLDKCTFPPNLRLVLSRTHPLKRLRPGRRVLDLTSLNETQRRQVIERFCGENSLVLETRWIDKMAQTPAIGNFLHLGIILREIKRLADTREFPILLEKYLECRSSQDLLALIIRVWMAQNPEPAGHYRSLLNLICFSSRGFQEAELAEMTGAKSSSPGLFSAKALRAAEPWLLNLSGFFLPFHETFRKVIRRELHPRPEDERAIIQQIVDYFFTRDLGPRVLDELPGILRKSCQWQKLHSILSDPYFLSSFWQTDPLHLHICLELVERNSDFRLGRGIASILKNPDRYWNELPAIAEILESFDYFPEAAAIRQHRCDRFHTDQQWEKLHSEVLASVHSFREAQKSNDLLSLFEILERQARERGDDEKIREILLRRADILQAEGAWEKALEALAELGRICERTGNTDGQITATGLTADIYYRQGRLDESLAGFRFQEQLAKNHDHKEFLIQALSGQAMILRIRGDLDAAAAVLRETENLCRSINCRDGLQRTLNHLAIILRTRGDLGGALFLLSEAEKICRDINDRDGLQVSLGGQAQISRIRGDLDTAMRLFQEQEKISRDIGAKEGLQIALGGQAVILKDRGLLEQAMVLSREAEKICREIDYREGLQRILGNQAMILRDQGDLDGAMGLLREAEKICRHLGLKAGLQRILEYLSLVLRARGDLDGAMALLREQEKTCRDLGLRIGLQVALGNQAGILSFRGDLDGAMALYREQEQICRELGLKDRLHISLGGQAIIFRARANFPKAVELLKEQERVCLELGLKLGLQVSLYNQGIIKLTLGDLDGAMILFQEQERICREAGYREGLQASLGSQAVIKRSRGDLEGSMKLFKDQEDICTKSGYKEGLQVSLCGQAAILLAQGFLIQARALLEQGEKICRELSHKEGLQRILCSKAQVLKAEGNNDGAMVILREAEKICRSLDYKSGLQRILENIGAILQARGDVDGAVHLLDEQERICRESGIRAGLQAALGQKALILKTRGEDQAALKLLVEQENLCRELGLKAGLAKSMAHQAEILARSPQRLHDGLFLAAKAFHLTQIHGLATLGKSIRQILLTIRAKFLVDAPIWKEMEDIEAVKNRMSAKAAVLRHEGGLDQAIDHLREQEKIYRETNQNEEMAASLARRAQVHREQGEFYQALKLFQEAAHGFRQVGNPVAVAEAVTNQALTYILDLNKINDAVPILEEAVQLSQAHELPTQVKETIELLQDLALAKQLNSLERKKPS